MWHQGFSSCAKFVIAAVSDSVFNIARYLCRQMCTWKQVINGLNTTPTITIHQLWLLLIERKLVMQMVIKHPQLGFWFSLLWTVIHSFIRVPAAHQAAVSKYWEKIQLSSFALHMFMWEFSAVTSADCHWRKNYGLICYVMWGLFRSCPLETEQWHIALADCTSGSHGLNRPYSLSAMCWRSLSEWKIKFPDIISSAKAPNKNTCCNSCYSSVCCQPVLGAHAAFQMLVLSFSARKR